MTCNGCHITKAMILECINTCNCPSFLRVDKFLLVISKKWQYYSKAMEPLTLKHRRRNSNQQEDTMDLQITPSKLQVGHS